MMAKRYDVEGTKTYLWAAVILAVLAVWHGIDGWVPQERWLAKYPEMPELWYDMGLYEFYAYNRWTTVFLAVGAVVCAYIHRIVK
jgi:hypothetical protein